MAKAVVLKVDRNGRIVGANQTAEERFGPCVGRICCEVVAATELDGGSHCTPYCASELLRAGGDDELTHGVSPRGRLGLTCSKVDDEVIVVLQDQHGRPPSKPLTPRELEVMNHVAAGMTNARIARELSISASTVRTHIEHILEKFNARSRAEAVASAMLCGLIK